MPAIHEADAAAITDGINSLAAALAELLRDPPDAGPARVRAIVALDALEQCRKRLSRDMVREMLETGTESFDEGPWRISVQAGRVTVNVIDPEAVPPAFRKEVPDTSMIRRYLDKHPTTNWATLETGQPYLVIRNNRSR